MKYFFWAAVERAALLTGRIAVRLHLYNGWIFAITSVAHNRKLRAQGRQ